jgi:hypothetical protein
VQRNYPLLIGACGWSHSGWLADFYPQDLPVDWHLSYYANEFPVVLVTAQEWNLPEAAVSQWCEDTEASFRFVVEITANTVEELQLQLERIVGFGERCVGLLLVTSLYTEEIALNELLEVMTNFGSLCLDFGAYRPDESVKQSLRQRQIGWCWHGDGSAEGLSEGLLAVTRIHSKDANPRQIRRWVETALASSMPQRQSILLFEGEPPNIAVMRQAQIILDLL